MTLTIHRAERSDVLVRSLAAVLAAVPADPFTPDLVSVPSRGVERWIAQSLSTTLGVGGSRAAGSRAAGSRASAVAGDGVCANVSFPSPGRLVRDALAASCDVDPDQDPWTAQRLVWPLLEVVDASAGEDWCRTLGRHLGVDDPARPGQGRRMAVAQKLAGLYSAYAAERPAMLLDWRAGQDTDGYGAPLAADLAWQAELWRRLRDHVGSDSVAERLEPGCRRLREQPGVVDLPERFSVFGPTRLTTQQLTVLDALATHREVHLWLPHPSAGLWQHLADDRGESPREVAVPRRRDDPTIAVPQHPLVRSLGRDAREMQLRLAAHTSVGRDEHLPTPESPATLLGAVQADLRADRAPDGRHVLAAGDRSISVHACHGRHRQVEVLREVLLGLLDDDPSLELRDVIVMCPDVEAYAPLISAAFGVEAVEDLAEADDGAAGVPGDAGAAGAEGAAVGAPVQPHPGHQLTFRLADRSLRQTNPVLGVLARVLDLADARLTASEVLDLLAMGPVRRTFGLDEDDLERVGDWVRNAGVRWGIDASGRAPYGLGEVGQNTWRHGLDRILVGVAMDEDGLRSVGTALPLDDVDSTEVDLAGRLAEVVDRLDAAVAALTVDQPLDDWVAALSDVVEAFADVAPQDAWQVSQAQATLAGVAATATHGTTPLRLSDVRALLGDRLAGRPTRANFRTGHLTVCTMVPMRSVPHRVVCLLGLDDGVFPRSTRIDGDDILARDPRVGERDQRSEDRQLFLDAILAAEERLVVLYTGADERTGAVRPPAVPLGELLDVLDLTAAVPAGSGGATAPTGAGSAGGSVRDAVVVRHPLQPFDARNFTDTALGRPGAFSFDHASYAGSLAVRAGQTKPRGFLESPLPTPGAGGAGTGAAAVGRDAVSGAGEVADAVSLQALARFLEHPVRGFLRERLDVRTADEQREPSDAVPVDPDSLERWQVGDRMLRAGLSGLGRDAAERVERLRGELPPGRLGAAVLGPITSDVGELLVRSQSLRSVHADTYDISLVLPSGARLEGTVPGVYGSRILRVEYSRLSPKHRIRAWVQLLALSAMHSDRGWTSATVGRGGRNGVPVQGAFAGPVTAEDALAVLDELVEVYRLGLTRPLPVPPKTACAYAEKRNRGLNPDNAGTFASKEWLTKSKNNKTWGEYDDGDHRRCGLRDFADLLDALPVPGGPHDDEPHLFGQLARTIWSPLLAVEVVKS